MGTVQAEFATGQRVRVTDPRHPATDPRHLAGAAGTIRAVMGDSCDVDLDSGTILRAVPFEMIDPEPAPSPEESGSIWARGGSAEIRNCTIEAATEPKPPIGSTIRVKSGHSAGALGVVRSHDRVTGEPVITFEAKIGTVRLCVGHDNYDRVRSPEGHPLEKWCDFARNCQSRKNKSETVAEQATSHAPAIARGAALWQLKDPADREVMIGIRGDVVTVTASNSPGADAHTARFDGPVDYSRVGEAIDFVILHRLREPFTFEPIHFPPPGDPRWRLPR